MKNLYQVFYTNNEGRKVNTYVVAESVAKAAGAVTDGKVNDVKDMGDCIVVK
jgi:hypothetical protein